MRAWLLPAVLGTAVLMAWGGAELLLRLQSRPEVPAPPSADVRPAAPSTRGGPSVPAAPAQRDGRMETPPMAGDRSRPSEASRSAPAAEAAHALPRVITPDQDVRWGASIITTGIRAVDGDSLVRGEERLRLLGIDAPELEQICRNPADNTTVACGRQAYAMLSSLLRYGGVGCTSHGTDRYGRTLARCLNGRPEELNRAMVLSGWALAAEGDPTYATEEAQAAAARRGLHALQFERPAAWRRAHPR